jgi:hypothetical protein
MKRYDPVRAPDPEAWLALDEQERIGLVAAHHRRTRAKLPNLQLHAVIHVIVENQLAERVAVVQKTLARLLAEGLDRHEAIHAIGSVAAEHLWKAMNETLRGPDLEEGYFRRLEALTARDWLEGAG